MEMILFVVFEVLIAISKSSKFFLACTVPHIEGDESSICVEFQWSHLHTNSSFDFQSTKIKSSKRRQERKKEKVGFTDVFLLEFTSAL